MFNSAIRTISEFILKLINFYLVPSTEFLMISTVHMFVRGNPNRDSSKNAYFPLIGRKSLQAVEYFSIVEVLKTV